MVAITESIESYFKEIEQYRPLAKAEEREALQALKAGDHSSFDKIINSNLLFVVKVAYKYSNLGVSLPDLIAEGNLGLVEAARCFDATKGYKFITYAGWHIKYRIIKALEGGKLVRYPVGRKKALKELREQLRALPEGSEFIPVFEEKIEAISLDAGDAYAVVSEEDVCAPLFQRDETHKMDGVPEEGLDRQRLIRLLGTVYQSLNKRECHIIKSYFGLEGQVPSTLAHIGKDMGISSERVRQVRDRALKKIRHRYGRILSEFLLVA